MHAATVVMRAGKVAIHVAGHPVHAGLQVTCAATVVMHGGTAVTQLPAGVTAVSSEVPQPATWESHELAEVSHGPEPMGPISAVVIRVGTPAGPRRTGGTS
jgi:hypothetical protein